MTALDRNDRIPDDAPQNKVKLEWITPKISLMKAGAADGKKHINTENGANTPISKTERILQSLIMVRPSHLATTLSTPANPNSTNGSAKTLFHAVRP